MDKVIEPKEIEYDSGGKEMKLLNHRHLQSLMYGIPNQFWTMLTEPGGKGTGWGFAEGKERASFKSHHNMWMQANHDNLQQHAHADGIEGSWKKFVPIAPRLTALVLMSGPQVQQTCHKFDIAIAPYL